MYMAAFDFFMWGLHFLIILSKYFMKSSGLRLPPCLNPMFVVKVFDILLFLITASRCPYRCVVPFLSAFHLSPFLLIFPIVFVWRLCQKLFWSLGKLQIFSFFPLHSFLSYLSYSTYIWPCVLLPTLKPFCEFSNVFSICFRLMGFKHQAPWVLHGLSQRYDATRR